MVEHAVLTCADCGATTLRRGPGQIYCGPCSNKRHRERQAAWSRGHPSTPDPEVVAARRAVLRQDAKDRTPQASITWAAGALDVELAWLVRVSVPFSYDFSKNAIWRFNTKGHVHLREQARARRDELTLALSTAINKEPRVPETNPFGLPGSVVQNRLWIDILVEKPDHRGDAVNVIDSVCDAVKVATRLDDRWYSIRRLDWLVTKRDQPRLFVGIGQEPVADAQVCSSCGQILGLERFGKRRSARAGIGRVCLECSRLTDSRRRERKRNAG